MAKKSGHKRVAKRPGKSGKPKRPSKPTKEYKPRYVKKVRHTELQPTKAQLEDSEVPRKARDLFSHKLVAGKTASRLDEGDDAGPTQAGGKGANPPSSGASRAKPGPERSSELLEGQAPGESMRDFERRLKRGTEAALRETAPVQRVLSDAKKRKNKMRKEKSKLATRQQSDSDDDAPARKAIVGLTEVAAEPPKLSAKPKGR